MFLKFLRASRTAVRHAAAEDDFDDPRAKRNGPVVQCAALLRIATMPCYNNASVALWLSFGVGPSGVSRTPPPEDEAIASAVVRAGEATGERGPSTATWSTPPSPRRRAQPRVGLAHIPVPVPSPRSVNPTIP